NLQGVGSSSVWRKIIEKRNVAAGFNLVLQEDPYLPTDTTSFYPKGIPVLAFFTGVHEDYHKPGDDADKVNYEGLQRIATLGKNITLDLANAGSRPDYLKVAKNDTGENRDSLRAYLGTIPDYSQEIKGVPLSGVRSGSPAEKGGVQAGDILIQFGGKKIETIYDYTSALDAAKIGQPVEVIVLRKEKELKLTVTPEERK
ncbi:MAG: PDZ domain-containing protein, partial [Verrucomicrobiales bacterium]